jgi:hypothetical protein
MEQRKLIGEILIEHGWVTPKDVNEALKRQAELADQGAAGTKTLGAILVEMGKVTDDQVRQALEEQGKAIYQDKEPVVAGSGLWGATERETFQPPDKDGTPSKPVVPPAPRAERPKDEPIGAGTDTRPEGRDTRSYTMSAENTEPRNDPSWRPGANLDDRRRGLFGIPWLQYVIIPTVTATAIMFGVRWYLNNRRKRTRMEWLKDQINQIHIPDEITDRLGKK